jgi:hypothetical protein
MHNNAILDFTQMQHTVLKVWLCVFIYAMLAGLTIQLVILPHVFPQLHAGNGLLAGRDWVGFHEQAVVMAQRIAQGGWSKFLLRPDGDNAITGVASFFYFVFSPHPWILLPLSGAAFASGGAALFSILKQLDLDDNEAIIAMLPYVVFPSALLQYGQIHKDVFCTAGALVVVWSWVRLMGGEQRLWRLALVAVMCLAALAVVSIFRPYLMIPLFGMGVLLLLWRLVDLAFQFVRATVRQEWFGYRVALKSNFPSTVVLLMITLFTYMLSGNYIDVQIKPISLLDGNVTTVAPVNVTTVAPFFVLRSNIDVRSADSSRVFFEGSSGSGEAAEIEVAMLEAAMLKAVEDCRPIVVMRDNAFFENAVNRVFLKIAIARMGFTKSGGATVASNIDKNVDFCKNEDLIRYIPRAVQIALFAPFPSSWLAVEKRNSSSVEVYLSAIEMLYCYIAYFGLLYWLVSYRRWRMALVIPIAFAFGLTLLLGLTIANVGTLYRMRFPFVMIFVSIGMAGILQLAKTKPRWVKMLDSNAD